MRLPVMDEPLARRILQSETDYFTSRISSIAERTGNPEGVEIRRFGHAAAYYIRTMPWGLFNSVKGFTPEDADQLEELLQFYRERKRAFQLDVNPINSTPKLLRTFAENGLFQESFHSVLYGLPASAAPRLPSAIRIRPVETEADFDRYAALHCLGNGMELVHKHHFANNNIGLLRRPGWTLYLASWEETPAAVAVMHVSGRVASFTLAATAPEYRRLGLQSALLQWRLHEAYKSGCELVAAQAASGSSSQRNMERAGLRLAWTRSVWAPLTV